MTISRYQAEDVLRQATGGTMPEDGQVLYRSGDKWVFRSLTINEDGTPEVILAIGLEEDLPSEPASDFYWASDTGHLFVANIDEWETVNPDSVEAAPIVAKISLNNGGAELNVSGAGVAEIVAWDVVVLGDGVTVDLATNPTRITVPAGGAGTYHIIGALTCRHIDTTHTVTLELLKNGVDVVWLASPQLQDERKLFPINTFDLAEDGDYYEIRLTIVGNPIRLIEDACFFEFIRLGA